MPTKTYRFKQIADLRIEGVGLVHASFILSLIIIAENIKEGNKVHVSASLICNAAKAHGSGKILPWCTVKNNIDNKKYKLDNKGKSFIINHDEILIGSAFFISPYQNGNNPSLEVNAGYLLETGYMGSITPLPGKLTRHIALNEILSS